jgi:hypothetical protein
MSNDANPLYYDYYGLAKELYEVTWKSKGSHELAEKIVDLFKKVSSKLHVGIRSKRVSGGCTGIDFDCRAISLLKQIRIIEALITVYLFRSSSCSLSPLMFLWSKSRSTKAWMPKNTLPLAKLSLLSGTSPLFCIITCHPTRNISLMSDTWNLLIVLARI